MLKHFMINEREIANVLLFKLVSCEYIESFEFLPVKSKS